MKKELLYPFDANYILAKKKRLHTKPFQMYMLLCQTDNTLMLYFA